MNGYLVDTNVISEFERPLPDANVVRWLRSVDADVLFASVITFGELRLGIESLTPGKRRTELEEWMRAGLPGWFASHLLPFIQETAGHWAELTAEANRKGLQLKTADGQIGATALEHNLTLVTRNGKDFAGLGIEILNPWEPRM